MRILIITEKIDKNNEIFGFFHSRLLDFVKKYPDVSILCLEKREHNLPSSIPIFSLGKEIKKSRLKYLWNFYKFIWRQRKNYDIVFVHLTPHYVVLGGWLWRLLRKKVILWYQHAFVDGWLKAASFFAKAVLVPAKRESYSNVKKIKVYSNMSDLEAFPEFIANM